MLVITSIYHVCPPERSILRVIGPDRYDAVFKELHGKKFMDKVTLTDPSGNKYSISSMQDLIMILDILMTDHPQIGILEIPEFGVLTFGLSKTMGFLEYMAENQQPPYLIANFENPVVSGEFLEFDSGGTATPIPLSYCIPSDLVIQILVETYKKRKLPDYINWYKG